MASKVDFYGIEIDCSGLNALALPTAVSMGDCPYLTVQPCPVCGGQHRITWEDLTANPSRVKYKWA